MITNDLVRSFKFLLMECMILHWPKSTAPQTVMGLLVHQLFITFAKTLMPLSHGSRRMWVGSVEVGAGAGERGHEKSEDVEASGMDEGGFQAGMDDEGSQAGVVEEISDG